MELPDLFKVKRFLGVGAFGVVLLVKNRMSNEMSAVKIINKKALSEHSVSVIKNESKILKSLDHPNIVSFKQIYENSSFLIIEMEYLEGG